MTDATADLGRLDELPRAALWAAPTPLEPMDNLRRALGAGPLYVKRDDCMGLAFGGNKVRQLEFYLGEAQARDADTVLITGAVQSNFVRLAAAGARKLGMDCHIQLEERVPKTDPLYRNSGNVLLDKLLGATLHSYPHGEDEEGADRRLGEFAADLAAAGRRPYIIPLGPGHTPLGALGYVVAARELLGQLDKERIQLEEIVVPSGSGNTHAGFLFGLRALGSTVPVTGICVRRGAEAQWPRIQARCAAIAGLLGTANAVRDEDINLDETCLAPGYGQLNPASREAIRLAAHEEALLLDPVYSAKTMAGFIVTARQGAASEARLFLHTGGTPALFAYGDDVVAGNGD